MRLFVSGSAPLSAETHKEFSARTGHAILERYGMTETNMNTSNPYDGDRIPGSVGLPLPGVEIRITDPETGAMLPQGEIGMIEVRGPNVFKGYWRMPEKTKAEFREDGFFISGDLGYIDPRGYVYISGRGKDLIISGGFNVYPAEVEGAIEALPGVAECAVIGVPHADFGEGVVAVVTAKPGAALDEKQMIAALGTELAKYKLPKRIYVADSLPRNAMGKVQKNELRETSTRRPSRPEADRDVHCGGGPRRGASFGSEYRAAIAGRPGSRQPDHAPQCARHTRIRGSCGRRRPGGGGGRSGAALRFRRGRDAPGRRQWPRPGRAAVPAQRGDADRRGYRVRQLRVRRSGAAGGRQ